MNSTGSLPDECCDFTRRTKTSQLHRNGAGVDNRAGIEQPIGRPSHDRGREWIARELRDLQGGVHARSVEYFHRFWICTRCAQEKNKGRAALATRLPVAGRWSLVVSGPVMRSVPR